MKRRKREREREIERREARNANFLSRRALNVGHTFYNGSTAATRGLMSSTDALKALLVSPFSLFVSSFAYDLF